MRRSRRHRRRLLWAGVLLGLLLLVLVATVASAAVAAVEAAGRLPGRLAALTQRQEGEKLMRRSIPTVLAALAAGVAIGSVSLASASPAARGAETLTLVAVETGAETYLDVGARGDSFGDGVYFTENLYRAGRKAGRTDVVCHFFSRSAARCSGSISLAAGRLEASGTIRGSGRTFGIPVVGGTGTYAGAKGVLRITELGETRSRYVIRLV